CTIRNMSRAAACCVLFFSSRRRHTRFSRDWSSDVCSSDLPKVPTPTRVDELVVGKLRKLGIVPSELCSDEEFLRRVSLDLTGTRSEERRVGIHSAFRTFRGAVALRATCDRDAVLSCTSRYE